MNITNKFDLSLLLPIFGFIFVTYLFHFWFYGSGIISYGDWYPYNMDNIKDLREITIFNPNNVGYGEAVSWLKPLLIFTSYLSNLGFGIGWLTRVIFILPGIIAAYWGTYLWTKSTSQNTVVSTICAFIMVLNSYSLVLSTGHLTLYSAINFIPLALYLYDKIMSNPYSVSSRVYNLLLILTSLLISFYEFRIFLVYAGILVLYIIHSNSFRIKSIILDKGLLSLISVLAINIFWVLPIITAESKPYGEFLVRQIFGNEFLNTNYALSITHPFWTLSGITAFITNKISIVYWTIPALIIYLTWRFNPKDLTHNHKAISRFYFFAVIFLIGVLLSKQSAAPFSGTYKWLFNNVPYFVVYREATKFFTLLIIGLIGMISSYNYKPKSRISNILLGLVFLSILINSTALQSGKIGGVHNPPTRPSMYPEINSVIIADSDQFNTLWVPRFSRWSYYSNDKPRVSHSDLAIFYKNQNPTVDRRNFEIITDEKFMALITQANTKYIIGIDDEEFNNNGDVEKLISISNDNPNLLTKLKESDEYVIFLNNNYDEIGNIYLTREAFNLYTINISNNSDNDFYLPVKYDPNWIVTANTSLTETIFKRNWINNVVSQPNQNGLQEFIVPANPDLPTELYIQYLPDAYHKVGFILSGVFFILISIIILFPVKNRIELMK